MALNTITPLTEYVFTVASIDNRIIEPGDPPKAAIVITLEYAGTNPLSLAEQNYEFVQTEELTEAGIAVQPYGALIINTFAPSTLGELNMLLKTAGGVLVSDVSILDIVDVIGATVTFEPESDEGGGE